MARRQSEGGASCARPVCMGGGGGVAGAVAGNQHLLQSLPLHAAGRITQPHSTSFRADATAQRCSASAPADEDPEQALAEGATGFTGGHQLPVLCGVQQVLAATEDGQLGSQQKEDTVGGKDGWARQLSWKQQPGWPTEKISWPRRICFGSLVPHWQRDELDSRGCGAGQGIQPFCARLCYQIHRHADQQPCSRRYG